MEQTSYRVGFALCGSFCTLSNAIDTLEAVKARFGDVTPIVSETTAALDTRFGESHEFLMDIERICDKRVIDSLLKAEPLGPKKLLDALIICPCTGNTLGKLAGGIADSTVTLAAKAHLRNGRPLILAVSTNDALASSAKSIGALMDKKNVYFVPFRQDDPHGKPTSLVADFSKTADTVSTALLGKQLQPMLLAPKER